jgi:hypothetical protein
MSNRAPQAVNSQIYFDAFWEQLSWEKLERKIKAALSHPDQAVPLETNCLAVMDLVSQIITGLRGSAIQRPGEVVSNREALTFDQRLVVLRILEAVVSEYEDWKNATFPARATPDLRPYLKSLEEKK